MTSYYAKHFGGEHYSPSTLSLFSNCPGMFIMSKCHGIKTPVGAAAHRGTSAELGIAEFLLHPQTCTVEKAQDIAMQRFRELTALSTDPNREKEQDAVPDIVAEGIRLLQPYGIPTAVQEKVSWTHPDLPLPVIGFIDFSFGQHDILIDLKTQLRLASSIAINHARQVSLYQTAKGPQWKAGIGYVTPKKSHVLQVEGVELHMLALVNIAKRLEKFCSISADPQELASLVAPDFDSFYWNDPQARREAFKIWGY